MNISLTPELEKLVQKKVASGLYTSASEVIREALRLFEAEKRSYEQRLDNLRQDIETGIKDADNGRLIEGSEVFKKIKSRRKKK
ncbi:type II toxin-antitoxin system ParD family antitoxin [bacterium]|nr:type II toxin-antitoxin system ParD family antitoxin [bacterium]